MATTMANSTIETYGAGKRSGIPGKLVAGFISCTAALLFASPVLAGPITSYQMDSLNPRIPGSFTFSVDDMNGDGLATADEIIQFSGFTCGFCSAQGYGPVITTLGSVANDLLFGGSGESVFDLTTLNWTYESTSGVSLLEDFSWSDADGNGSPFRLYTPVNSPVGRVALWQTSEVPEPGTLALMLIGIGALMRQNTCRRPHLS